MKIVKVKPSALASVSWNEKSVVKDCTLTAVEKNALPASFAPVLVRRKRLPLIAALPERVRPVALSPEA